MGGGEGSALGARARGAAKTHTEGRHKRTVPSAEADASKPPSGAKHTLCTAPVWPCSRNARNCGRKLHNVTVPSVQPAASWLSLGDHDTDVTGARCTSVWLSAGSDASMGIDTPPKNTV